MPNHTAAEKEKKRRNRSADAIAALDASEQGSRPAPKKRKPRKEAIGTGRDDSQTNFDRLAAGLRQRISAARKTGNNTLAAKLEARLVELRKTVQ